MKKKLLLIVPMAVLMLVGFVADDDWLSRLLAKLEVVKLKYPQEKVHLHLDKPYYSIGDDMWLKAYVVDAENNQLSAISSVLYVDLIDDQDSVRKTLALPVANGLSNGDVRLSDSLFTAGTYHVKAYTRWMQNFSPDYFFSKEVVIGDARRATAVLAEAKFTIPNTNELIALVVFKNLINKQPMNGKAVSYMVKIKNKMIASGKSTTDADGKARITAVLKPGENVKDAVLYASIALEPDNYVTRTFPVYDENARPDVQFFPESGTLIAGIRSKVGFKAVGPDGRGAKVRGTVVDQNDKTIVTFNTLHAGMGVFAMQPVAGSTYTAVIKNEAGKENRYPLPAVASSGYVLAVDKLKDSIALRINASKELANGKEVAVVGLQNGIVRFTSKLKMDQPVLSARISDTKFSTGIVQFTLLSADALPLAERLSFINHQDQLNLAITTAQTTYGKREKVDMNLDLRDDDRSAVEGNLSLAVTDAGKVKSDEDSETSIMSDLLLSSDLRGSIEDVNYYFNNVTDQKQKELDNLMLTQGWRRFTWTDLKNDALPVLNYTSDQGIKVSGTITTLSKKPVPFGKVSMFALTRLGPRYVDTVADANGRFVIDGLNFEGDTKIVVRARNVKESENVRVILDKEPAIVYGPYLKPNLMLSTTMVNYLEMTQKRFEQMNYGITARTFNLDEVSIRETKIPDKNVVKYSSKIGTGIPNITIKKEKVGTYQNLWYAFYGLPNIEVRGRTIYSVGRVVRITNPKREPMLLRVDGVDSPQLLIQYIPPQDVEGIEIFNPGANSAIYGNDAYWGVIEITTKRGGSEYIARDVTNLNTMVLHGLSARREFYAPVYGRESDSKATDMRSTIYWEPNIVTNTDGKAKVSFYTADEPGTYKAIAEGINLDGKLVRQVYTFSVK